MKIGFAGLGGMGSAMAANLLQAGFALTVWNRSPRAQPLVSAGAQQAERPEQLADADVLITMLADDAATQQVVVDSGLLQRMKPGALHINMATISVELAKRLTALHAEHGIGYLAAPVLGRVDVAAAGKLNILAAGDSELLKQAQPLFDALGQKTWHFGADPAQANVVKIATNFTLASAIEAMAEGSALVRNYGVSGADYLQMLSSTVFAAPAYQGYGALIAAESIPRRIPAGAGAEGRRAGAGRRGRQPYADAVRRGAERQLPRRDGAGDADLDWAALAKVAARRAGLK